MKRKGFTFIELLVVVITVSILAAILFPVFAKVRDRAFQGSDVNNEKQIGLAIAEYVQDNNETYPMVAQYNPNLFGACGNLWDQTIQPYVKSLSIFGSPADPQALQPVGFPGGVSISYAINGIVVDVSGGSPNHLRGVSGFENAWFGPCSLPSSCGSDISAQSISTIPKPAKTILLTNCFTADTFQHVNSDSITLSCGFEGGSGSNPGPDNVGNGYFDSEAYPSGLETTANGNTKAYQANVSTPFGNGTTADFLFVDGHVAPMVPVSTNPNPVTMPAENLWVCNRPDNDSQPVNWAQ